MPIPAEDRLVRAVRRQQEHVAHAELLERIACEVGGDVAAEQAKHRGAHTAVDGIALRGIPAIGRGCSGAIRGTRPGENLFLERRKRRREAAKAP
jgi:hypothetical protein